MDGEVFPSEGHMKSLPCSTETGARAGFRDLSENGGRASRFNNGSILFGPEFFKSQFNLVISIIL